MSQLMKIQMLNWTFRKLHAKVAPVVFLPLILTALTGMGYRLGKSWFGVSNRVAHWLMVVHEGQFLGKSLVPFYVLLVGLSLIGMIITGITLIKPNPKGIITRQWDRRWLHRVVALAAVGPLLLTALTGIGYRVGQAWFGLPSSQASILMRLHQGSYLSPGLRPLYILAIGAGLLVLLWTGIQMTTVFWQRRFH